VVGAIVVDFDGTICPQDVTEEILEAYAPRQWWDIDVEFQRGLIGARECLVRQTDLVKANREDMLRFALSRFAVEPSFGPFVAWAGNRGIPVAVASDGMGFYVEPMLEASGIQGVAVLVNEASPAPEGLRLTFPYAHPVCVGCGTCKMQAVLRYRDGQGSVAFVGEGHTDRYGALFSDVVFAKKHLVDICRADRVPYLPWETFDDVSSGLETIEELPGPVWPERCPGWTFPDPVGSSGHAPPGPSD